MKIIKVAEATGIVLDYLVAIARGASVVEKHHGDFQGFYVVLSNNMFSRVGQGYSPSSRWNQGGPIIEAELLDVTPYDPGNMGWRCTRRDADYSPKAHPLNRYYAQFGPTPLIAAMRCFCVSKLGETAEIPEKLK